MQLSREWSKSASTDNIEKTLFYWADDTVILIPGQLVKGKEAIRVMMLETFKIPGLLVSWEPISVEVSERGDMAYMPEVNKVTFKDSTGWPVKPTNKAVTIWKKQTDGSWKNIVDIWNASPEYINP